MNDIPTLAGVLANAVLTGAVLSAIVQAFKRAFPRLFNDSEPGKLATAALAALFGLIAAGIAWQFGFVPSVQNAAMALDLAFQYTLAAMGVHGLVKTLWPKTTAGSGEQGEGAAQPPPPPRRSERGTTATAPPARPSRPSESSAHSGAAKG